VPTFLAGIAERKQRGGGAREGEGGGGRAGGRERRKEAGYRGFMKGRDCGKGEGKGGLGKAKSTVVPWGQG